ncbi:UbiA family prenyltransferase [Diaphorobacter sp. HDW4A]|uniref:UbiA family prenyltransferase n=1 Tax=Diaphorobacter sp. HDW4A TaxID=2714924 RepID=UPI00140C3E93|nr:UbiA family prenyltransferase [Diaphorobacter sp. HDW4A]QIL79308.1 UbiA family prenyltransferase [Diaphorobacter sp. HDW4A]
MSGPLSDTKNASARGCLRVLGSIRLDEVLVLQGTPMMGALLASSQLAGGLLSTQWWQLAALLVAGNLCLMAHVFVVNDWAEIKTDIQDPTRSARTFASKGVTRTAVGWLALATLFTSLLLLGMLNRESLMFGMLIVATSALYSLAPFHMKARPIGGTALHVIGGALHFLLGYAAIAPATLDAWAISVFFGLVFAAGHLNHEIRGLQGDRLNHIRTNAVVFGQRPCFVAAFILFSMAYALLLLLALQERVPRGLLVTALLYPVHGLFTWKALRNNLNAQSLLRLQTWYRLLYALVGVLIAWAVIWHQG